MPLSAFPLPEPAPDPAEAARLLALTQTALEGPIAALSDAAGGGLTQTAGQLQAIQRRLMASGQARLRATGKDLGQVLDTLHQGAQAALAETAATLSLTAQRAGTAGRPPDQTVPVATPTSVYWAALHCPDLQGRVIPAERGSPPAPGEGWRTYGPYTTDAQAQQALATYRTYLRQDMSCMQATAGDGGPPPPALDYYWVD